MTEEMKNEAEEVVEESAAEESPAPEGESLEELRNKLAEAESKAAEYKDGLARERAEFQNYKKRVARDNESAYANMKGDIIKKVLPVLDDLERALQNRVEGDAWANGIELIARKLQNTLEAEGIKKIEAKGAAFDPNFHEAISHEPAEGVESGHIIEVVQNGYMLGERVIRPALVRVAQ